MLALPSAEEAVICKGEIPRSTQSRNALKSSSLPDAFWGSGNLAALREAFVLGSMDALLENVLSWPNAGIMNNLLNS